jgi:hypothetical protein
MPRGAQPVISRRVKRICAMRCIRHLVGSSGNYEFRLYFAKKLQGRQREPGILTKKRVKLAAKLLTIAWTLMIYGAVDTLILNSIIN